MPRTVYPDCPCCDGGSSGGSSDSSSGGSSGDSSGGSSDASSGGSSGGSGSGCDVCPEPDVAYASSSLGEWTLVKSNDGAGHVIYYTDVMGWRFWVYCDSPGVFAAVWEQPLSAECPGPDITVATHSCVPLALTVTIHRNGPQFCGFDGDIEVTE